LMIEGSGSISFTNRPDLGGPKNIMILRIRIRNTDVRYMQFQFFGRDMW
jgi:hypothetical protein